MKPFLLLAILGILLAGCGPAMPTQDPEASPLPSPSSTISPSPEASQTPTQVKSALVLTDLYLRDCTGVATPGISCPVVSVLKQGEQVKIYGQNGNWVRLDPSRPLWACALYMK